ncbi:MAG TPA: outer membrane beta-barrel protein [Puia sp.]|nr:outer membrane beta-barrel protein [Puia sp.]
MVRNFKLLIIIVLGNFTNVQGQDSSQTASTPVPVDSTKKTSPPVTITGSFDGYYRFNFNDPKQGSFNSPTSFTHSSNSFELGMASIRADHSFGKVSATVDLGFGTRAAEFSYNDAGTTVAIKQLYVTYAPSAKIKFTLGTWGTHVGYEVLDAYLNRNYSMSYMFTYGPFSHTGLKADISLAGKTALMVGIANPTDYRSAPGMPKSFIAQLSTGSKDDKFKAFLNFVDGKQTDDKNLMQEDLVLTYAISGKFSLGYNGTIQTLDLKQADNSWNSVSWWGSALYVNVDPVNWFGLTLRGEYIGNKDGWVTNSIGSNSYDMGNVFEGTLSANFRVDNLTIIPEFRLDNGSNAAFYKNNSTDPTKSTGSFILAATYHF